MGTEHLAPLEADSVLLHAHHRQAAPLAAPLSRARVTWVGPPTRCTLPGTSGSSLRSCMQQHPPHMPTPHPCGQRPPHSPTLASPFTAPTLCPNLRPPHCAARPLSATLFVAA